MTTFQQVGHERASNALVTALQPMRITRCNVIDSQRVQCSGEAMDPTAEILICTRHAALVLQLITNAQREAA